MADRIVVEGDIELNPEMDGDGGIVREYSTTDYRRLANKPSINRVELDGNKSLSDLGLLEEIGPVVDDINANIDTLAGDIDNIANDLDTAEDDIRIIMADLAHKVDKETGKGLSTNDYTNEEKAKLNGIESGAEVNVQSDWNAESGDAFIRNKPSIPSKTSDLANDSGFLTQETDPTVPSWAKQPAKPAYTAQEVGALPAGTPIPTKTSDLTNDSGYLTLETLPIYRGGVE